MDRLRARFPRYSTLLRLYPQDYQRKYGEQMLQTLADMLDDPHQSHVMVWLRTTLDFPVSLSKQQLTYTGAAMKTTPPYLKHYALTGAWMIAPFFVLVVLNSLLHQHLQNSFVWHSKALFVWLVLLPSIAIILNLGALLRWIQQRRNETGKTAWRVLTDFRQSWPAVGVALVGLGILALALGHDSVHCATGSPIREFAHWHQTLRCIQQR